MKKKLIARQGIPLNLASSLTLIIFFISLPKICFGQCCSQKEPKQVIINFKEHKIDKNGIEGIKKGEFYNIKVEGINLNHYRISYGKVDSAKVEPLKLPIFSTSFGLDEISKVVGTLSSMSTKLVDTKKDFENQNLFMKEGMIDNGLIYNNPKKLKLLDDAVLGRYRNTFDHLQVKIDETFQLYKKIETELITAKKKYEEFQLNVGKYNYQYTTLNKSISNDNYDIHDGLEGINSQKIALFSLIDKLQTNQTEYLQLSNNERDRINNSTTLKGIDTTIKSSHLRVLKSLNAAIDSMSSSKLIEILNSSSNINNDKDVSFFPVEFNGNKTVVKLNFERRDPSLNLVNKEVQFTIPSVDQSYAFVGLSYYYSFLKDDFYTETKYDSTYNKTINNKDSTLTSTKYKYGKENTGGELGLAALLKIGKKIGKTNIWGIHGSIGMGISLSSKIKPRVLYGVGLTYGKTHMVTFDFGGILGYVDRKSDNVVIENKTFPSSINSVTVSKLRTNVFISIGYAFKI